MMSDVFYDMDADLRRRYLESEYDTPEEFLSSLKDADREPMQFPRNWWEH